MLQGEWGPQGRWIRAKGPHEAEDVSLGSGDVFQSYLESHYIVQVILKSISSDSAS